MKVLHVIDRMDPERGGVCQAVRTIAFGLNGMGVKNEIVSLDAPDASFLKKDSFNIYALGPAKKPWSYSKNLKPWLFNNMSGFDVVIIHGLWQYPSHAVKKIWSKLKNKPKLFVMPHGMLDPYFQRASGRKLKALRNTLYWALIEKHVVNNATGLLFTCEAERVLAHQPFKPYKPKKELVVGLGVESPPPFKPKMEKAFQERCPEFQNSPYILFISRIHEKKGVDLLLHAYAKIAENKNNALEDLPKLVIAGPGIETAYGKHVLDIVNKNKFLKAQVCFPGMLKGDAKWGSFYGCEAFILPSHQENFGIAVVEALACSKPVLISNQVNIWTEIEKAKGGYVNNDSIAGTQKSLETFLNINTSEKALLYANARLCFETYFEVDKATKTMFQEISK